MAFRSSPWSRLVRTTKLVWDVDESFQLEQLSELAKLFGAKEEFDKVWIYRGVKLVLQGSRLEVKGEFDEPLRNHFLEHLSSIHGLHLRPRYKRALTRIDSKQSYLMCPICVQQIDMTKAS